jgi:hypothetical protein
MEAMEVETQVVRQHMFTQLQCLLHQDICTQ